MTTVRYEGRDITPGKIVCIGRNYVAHARELGNEVPDDMVLFLKPASAIGTELRAALEEPLHYEGELSFLMGESRLEGVAFGLDLTKRALQSSLKEKSLPWERAKAFDGAALFSEFVPLTDDPASLALALHVDGELQQSGHCGLMMYPPATILEQLGVFMSLEDGDIVMTGTPAGVGPVVAGATYTGSISSNGRELLSHSWLAA